MDEASISNGGAQGPTSWEELYNINLIPSELFLKFRKEVQGIRVGLNLEVWLCLQISFLDSNSVIHQKQDSNSVELSTRLELRSMEFRSSIGLVDEFSIPECDL